MIHVLIAVDELRDEHVADIAEQLTGVATLERIEQGTPDEVYAARLQEAEVVYGWPPIPGLLVSNIKLLQLPYVGYDKYVGHGLESKANFTLCNARGTMGPGIAEHTLALMLAFARHLPQHLRDAQERRWQRVPVYGELAGATACIVGLGDLGTAIAQRCAALDMHVIGVRRDAAQGHSIAERVYPIGELRTAVAEAEHVIAMLPASPQTTHIFDSSVFAAMKHGSYFYNIGRGSTVDEVALLEHLQSGQLAGAGLDVFEQEPLPAASPLWSMDNVIVMPHVAGRSAREYDRQRDLLLENLRRYIAGQPLLNVIDL